MTQPAFSVDISAPIARHMPTSDPRTKATAAGSSHTGGALRGIGPVLHFAQDRDIYSEGDTADVFFKLVSGVVRTCKFLNDGRRQIDSFYVAGEVFGLEAGDAHSLCAEAVSDCTVISYRRRGLETLAANDQALSRQLFCTCDEESGAGPGAFAFAGAQKCRRESRRLPHGAVRECARRQGDHPGDDAPRYRGLFGAHDGDGIANFVTIGTRCLHRAYHRPPDPNEGSRRATRS